MKFGSIRSLDIRRLFPEFGELWSGVPRYHAATCISPSLMHLLLWPPCRAGHYILQLWFLSSSFFLISSPILSGRRLDVYHTSRHNNLSANLECMSEMCCTRLAENTGRKNYAKNRHLCTIEQLCRAVSSQLRRVSTIGKN